MSDTWFYKMDSAGLALVLCLFNLFLERKTQYFSHLSIYLSLVINVDNIQGIGNDIITDPSGNWQHSNNGYVTIIVGTTRQKKDNH